MTAPTASLAPRLTSVFALPFLLAFTIAASAQASPSADSYHGYSIGAAASYQLTETVTSQNPGAAGTLFSHQATTDSPGILVTLGAQPFTHVKFLSPFGFRANYHYTEFSERYVTDGFLSRPGQEFPTNLHVGVHEATGEFVARVPVTGKYLYGAHPYIGLGGGYQDFIADSVQHFQWRGTGIADVGMDFPTVSRLAFRVGARALAYRAPNFNTPALGPDRWAVNTEPYAGFFLRY